MSQYHIRMSRFEWDQLMQDYHEINEYFLSEHSQEVQEWNSQQALNYKNDDNPQPSPQPNGQLAREVSIS